MKKVIVTLGLARLTVPQKIQKVRTIVKAMTGNVNFYSPSPALPEISITVDVLEQAHEAALDGGTILTATMNARAAQLDAMMTALAGYVQSVSNGSEEVIRSAGMGIRNTPSPIITMTQPLNLRALVSSFVSEVDLKWTRVKGARVYVLETSPDGSTGWVGCGHSTRSTFNVKGLTSLSYVWFRIAAIGPAGQGPWSDAVRGLVG